jgi:hypothetical protein
MSNVGGGTATAKPVGAAAVSCRQVRLFLPLFWWTVNCLRKKCAKGQEKFISL